MKFYKKIPVKLREFCNLKTEKVYPLLLIFNDHYIFSGFTIILNHGMGCTFTMLMILNLIKFQILLDRLLPFLKLNSRSI